MAFLKQLPGSEWEMKTFTALQKWTSMKLCQHKKFFNVDENSDVDMNQLIAIEDFEHTFVEDGKEVASMDMIVTTQTLFSNVRQAVQDQGSDL
ncbi:unnamed protein product [Phytophthora lilii]|uniref:Unnamed protein product n=1 Tax=Phytophthora lilii TaxID=2077276 RepID=A0A9W6TZJ5_9STRA|nr:unnamed protein product [Phytophthora lilii]